MDRIDLLVSSMIKKINKYVSQEEATHRGHCTIHKVPQHIREVDRSSYEPIVLSICPYHQVVQSLVLMEKEKWKSLDFILKMNCKRTLHDYVKVAVELEKRARNCYSEDIKMERKQFIQMLLLDVCFVLVKIEGSVSTAMPEVNRSEQTVVQGNVGEHKASVDNHFVNQHGISEIEMELWSNGGPISATEGKNNTQNENKLQNPCDSTTVGDWYSIFTWHDLFLLENQIPFFVIDRIFRFVMNDDSIVNTSPAEKFSEWIEDILRQFPIAIRETDRPKQFHHFLHLCHMYLRPSQKSEDFQENQTNPGYLYRLLCGYNYTGIARRTEETHQFKTQMQQKDCFQSGQLPSRWRQATQYHEAGVGLVKSDYNILEKHSLLDIKFSSGVVQVPCFLIDENTESLFKNLIAVEQVDPRFGNDITAYIVFMSQFVSTSEDAVLLAEKGIIIIC